MGRTSDDGMDTRRLAGEAGDETGSRSGGKSEPPEGAGIMQHALPGGHDARRPRSAAEEISDARVLAEYGSMDVGWRRSGYRAHDNLPFILDLPPRSDEERDRMFAALEDLRVMRRELLRARGGRPFRPAAEDLAELRAERDGELA